MLKREITQAPVILLLSRTLAPLVHAVVAYGFDGDELLIYDPNFPGASQRTTSRGRVYKACGNGNCTEYSVTGFDHYLSTGRRTDWESLTTYAVGGFERSNDLYVNVEDGQEVSVRDLDFSGALSGDLLDDAVKVSVKFDDVRPIETADDGTFSGSVEGLRLGENTLVFLAGIHHNLATVAGRTLQFWKKRYWDIGSAAVVRNVVGRFDAAAVQIRLQWSLPTDLDLYVQEPGGEVLFWGNRLADSGFELSRDNRRTGSDERRDSEIALLSNTDTVADGVYRLFVHQYDDYGYNEPVDFRVQVSLNEGTISEANHGWSHTMALGRHGLGSATTVRDLLGSGLREAARVRVHLGRATVCWPYPEGTFDYCGDEFAATPVDAVNGDQTVVKPSANWVPDWLREADVQISIDSSSVPSSCVTESPWRGCYHRGHRATDGDLVEVRVTMPREPSGSWHGAWCVKDTPEGLCRGRHDSTDNIEKRFAENASLSFDADVPQDVTSFWIVGEIRECRKSLCYWPTDYDEVEFHHIEIDVSSGNARPSFAGVRVPNSTFSLGDEISPWQLPEATGGNRPLTYSVSLLPPELTFSPATRRITGTPTKVGEWTVAYTATDVDGDTVSVTFEIRVQDGDSGGTGGREPGEVFTDRLASGGEGPEMVVIPAGSFRMGCLNDDGDCSSYQFPVHTVDVPRFALAKFEVTWDQYNACVTSGGCHSYWQDESGNGAARYRTWFNAQSYVRWLSAETGQDYRLPSEAEWEYAARAGTTTAYSWGNEIGNNRANCDGCGSRWDDWMTAPVGSFGANAWGLHDMHGNVWEWTTDCWHRSFDGAPIDGSAWIVGCQSESPWVSNWRVRRGGSYDSSPVGVRASARTTSPANGSCYGGRGFCSDDEGIRVVRTLAP